MAIIDPYQEDEENDDEGLSTSALGQTANTPAAGAAPSVTSSPQNSGRFTNFARYFAANSVGANSRAGQLTGGLESAAQTAADQSSRDLKTATQGATSGTVTAAPTDPNMQAIEEANREKKSEYGYNPDTYTGPTAEQVGERWGDTREKARATTARMNQARDPEGIKALTGGTGFGASLAYASGGGRLAELRRRFGGLMNQVDADEKAAASAADAGVAASGAAADSWDAIERAKGAAWEKSNAELQAKKAAAKALEDRREAIRVRANKHEGVQGRTRTQSDEEYALIHGLTLDEWVNAGRPDLQHATKEDVARIKAGPGRGTAYQGGG